MRLFQPKTKRQYGSRFKKLTAIILAVAGIVLLQRLHQSFFIITKIDCRYGKSACPDPVILILKHYQNRSIFSLKQSQIISEVQSTGWGQNPRLSFSLPGKMIFELEPLSLVYPVSGFWRSDLPELSLDTATSSAELIPPSREIASYIKNEPGEPFTLTESGLLIEGGSGSPISIISAGQPGRDYLPRIFNWIKTLSYREIKFNQLYFYNDFIVVAAENSPDIIFAIDKPADPSLTALQEIIKTATIKDTKVIDFRYSNPILR